MLTDRKSRPHIHPSFWCRTKHCTRLLKNKNKYRRRCWCCCHTSSFLYQRDSIRGYSEGKGSARPPCTAAFGFSSLQVGACDTRNHPLEMKNSMNNPVPRLNKCIAKRKRPRTPSENCCAIPCAKHYLEALV